MSDSIKFWSEGLNEDGGRTFDSWQELARAEPWGLLDPETLTDAQRETLIAEMEAHAPLEAVKSGDERCEFRPDPFDPKAPALARFAAKNLPRLRPAPDPLELAEGEATAFLEPEIGAFNGDPTETFVQRRGKKWEVVMLKRGEPMQCERLIDLFELNLVPRLSPFWHAVRTLVGVKRAGDAADRGDVKAAMHYSFMAGESRRSLSMRQAKAAEGAKYAEKRAEKYAERDAQIRAKASEMRERNPALSNSVIAKRLAKDSEIKPKVGEHGIRRILAES